MSASGMLQPQTRPYNFTVVATGPATLVNVAGNSGTFGITPSPTFFTLPLAEAYYAELMVTASAGTVDLVLQHSTDNGLTWQNLPLKFPQSAAAGSSSALLFKPAIGLSDAAGTATPVATGAAVALNFPFNIKMLRPFATLGTAGTTNFTIRFTMTQKGNVVQ